MADIRNRETELGKRFWDDVDRSAAEGWARRWREACGRPENLDAFIGKIHALAQRSPRVAALMLHQVDQKQLEILEQEDFRRLMNSSERILREAAIRAAGRVGVFLKGSTRSSR